MAIRCRHYWVSGRVQGVGFRYFAYRRGRELGLAGWVRNLRDGRVEIQAQGDETLLEQFVASIREGPRASSVDAVQIEDCQTLTQRSEFTIET